MNLIQEVQDIMAIYGHTEENNPLLFTMTTELCKLRLKSRTKFAILIDALGLPKNQLRAHRVTRKELELPILRANIITPITKLPISSLTPYIQTNI
jgi:hypothetical protein